MSKKFGVLIFLIALLLVSCSSVSGSKGNKTADTGEPFETEDFLMGTVITQRIYGQEAQKAAEEAVNRLKDIEARMTINAPGGEINSLNEAAGKEAVKLSEDTVYLLEKAKKYAELSDGAFDVTVGPLVKAWGVFTDNPRIPSKEEITKLLDWVNYKSLSIDAKNLSVRLDKAGQIVDLGGIAKGYGGDEVIKIYKKHGIQSAYVNLGGNVAALGAKPDGSPWKIGIQNPRAETGSYIGIVNVTDKAVVSSGDYERFFEENGKRYHHIIDPKTGYPSDSGLIGTTIVADISADADALSTATFVLGLEKGMALIESLKGIDAVFITRDKKVYVTSGLKNNFKLVDKNEEFQYVEKR